MVVEPADAELDPESERWLTEQADTTARRNVALLGEYSRRPPATASHRIRLTFLRSATEIMTGADGGVIGIRLARNRLEAGDGGRLRAVPTAEVETIPCGLVLRAVGYRGRPLSGLPFDADRGVIPNDRGRVLGDDGHGRRGEYVVGWIKRGASGVIGTNKKDAVETVGQILADATADRLLAPAAAGRQATAAWLANAVREQVSWAGWSAIDRHERMTGERLGRPRRKLVALDAMFEVARSANFS